MCAVIGSVSIDLSSELACLVIGLATPVLRGTEQEPDNGERQTDGEKRTRELHLFLNLDHPEDKDLAEAFWKYISVHYCDIC